MTATTAPFASSRPHRLLTARAAGATYVVAWIVGLTAFGAGVAADAGDVEVAAHYVDHRVATAVQSLLVHGVAAAALLVVLTAVARARGGTRLSHVAGLVGVGLSAVQLALGLWRSLIASGSTVATLVDLIDRVDGVKILAFAVMIGAALPAFRRTGWIGRRMQLVGLAATSTLAVAGSAYLIDIEPLLVTAAPALVLLLAWVARLGVAADQRHT